MADPKTPATPTTAKPPARAANAPAPAPQPLTEEQQRLQRLFEKGGRVLSDDPEIARRAAQAEVDRLAHKAIEWKKARGVYPWEEPQSAEDKKIAAEQIQWAKEVGIDANKNADEFLGRVKDSIRRLEGQKKTEGRGR